MQTSTNSDPATKASSAQPAANGLLDDAKSLWQEVCTVAHDQLQLATLETKLAGESLVSMIAAGVVAAVLLVTAWLGLIAVAVLALVDSGMLASIAMLIAVTINLIVAFVLYKVVRHKSQQLRWPATLRSLKPRKTATPVQPTADYVNNGSGRPS